MPNYDFSEGTNSISFSPMATILPISTENRCPRFPTVLSAALNADTVEMPVEVIEDMLEQLNEIDTKFAKAELAKAELHEKTWHISKRQGRGDTLLIKNDVLRTVEEARKRLGEDSFSGA